MNTVDLPVGVRPSRPRRIRARRAETRHPLLWVSGALAIAAILFTVALVAGQVLAHDAVALEAPPATQDPFYQQKVEAKVEELPAQF